MKKARLSAGGLIISTDIPDIYDDFTEEKLTQLSIAHVPDDAEEGDYYVDGVLQKASDHEAAVAAQIAENYRRMQVLYEEEMKSVNARKFSTGSYAKRLPTILAWCIHIDNKPYPDWVKAALSTEKIVWRPNNAGVKIKHPEKDDQDTGLQDALVLEGIEIKGYTITEFNETFQKDDR